eukprot:1160804-Pelagomonas_calceolata.AAC.22
MKLPGNTGGKGTIGRMRSNASTCKALTYAQRCTVHLIGADEATTARMYEATCAENEGLEIDVCAGHWRLPTPASNSPPIAQKRVNTEGQYDNRACQHRA